MPDAAVPLELSREEILARLERGARRRCSMSAAEFVAAYYSGRLRDPGEVADLISLVFLLGDDDPLVGPAQAA